MSSLTGLTTRVKAEHALVAAAPLRDNLRHVLTAGRLLLEAKALIPDPQWSKWLSDAAITEREATLYIKVASVARPSLFPNSRRRPATGRRRVEQFAVYRGDDMSAAIPPRSDKQRKTNEMTYDYSDDNSAGDAFDHIVGAFLKCPKGKWLLDDVEIPIGPDGTRVTILMPTARHGRVVWENNHPTTSNFRRYADCDPPKAKMEPGFDPYTIFQCLIGDALATFASSSWGARSGFKPVVDNWRYLHRREFPIVILGTKPRHDVNGNIDPTFDAVAWVPSSNFAGMLADADASPSRQELPAPAMTTPELPPRGRGVVTSGLAQLAQLPADDGYAGVDPNDVIPFP